MPLVTLRDVLKPAQSAQQGIGAFTVSDTLMADAVLSAARTTQSPAILQVMPGNHSYETETIFADLLRRLISSYDDVDVVLSLDHASSLDQCEHALTLGFTNVMIDGSTFPDGTLAPLERNIELTKQVAKLARKWGASSEGELGGIGGAENPHMPQRLASLANPEQAALLATNTGVDAIGLAVGTAHGPTKFSRPPRTEDIRLDIFADAARLTPQTFFVLHAASTIPSTLVQRLRTAGGNHGRSFGISSATRQAAIRAGVTKVNQGYDLYLTYMVAIREGLNQAGSSVYMTPILRAAREELSMLVAERIMELKTAY